MIVSTVKARKSHGKLRMMIGLGVVVVLALLVAVQSYLWETHHPNLDLYNDHMQLLPQPHAFIQVESVHNSGRFAQHITGVTSSRRGVVMTSSNAIGLTLRPGRTTRIVLSYRVIDCRLVLTARGPRNVPVPVHLTLKRWWGDQSTSTTDHGADYDGGAFDAC